MTAAFVSTRGAVSVTTASSTWAISPNGATAINNTLYVAVRVASGWVAGVTDSQGNVWHTDRSWDFELTDGSCDCR